LERKSKSSRFLKVRLCKAVSLMAALQLVRKNQGFRISHSRRSNAAPWERLANPAAILDLIALSAMRNQMNTLDSPQKFPSTLAVWDVFGGDLRRRAILASLFTPPLLDDVDASHAQAAQHMAESGDWVTLKVNGIRYLEKPPLPYWLDAALYRVFGQNAFATHLPNALALLGCAWLAWLWAGRAWGGRAGFYAALGVLTSVGPFLFTPVSPFPKRCSAFCCWLALYCLLTGLNPSALCVSMECGRRWRWRC
jgi:hypothetical protein